MIPSPPYLKERVLTPFMAFNRLPKLVKIGIVFTFVVLEVFVYGINILYDLWEIEYDSLINPPRNREAGYPRVGRYVADPEARKKIEEVVNKWIAL